MKSCPKCNNIAPDNAAACAQCGMVLDESVVPGAASSVRSRIPTIVESSEETSRTFAPRIEYRPSPPPAPLRASGLPAGPPPPPAGRRGQTVYLPSSPQSSPALASASRRVLAVLVTYSWKPEGQVFPVREGRNLIGRGEECDIRLPEDTMLSLTNSHITYRQTFTIGDMVSMSGTDLNGEPVEEQFRPLTNLARIRAGSTHFLFVIVDPLLLGSDT